MIERAPITDEELEQWAKVRADDAGHLARELIGYRRARLIMSGSSEEAFIRAEERERCAKICEDICGKDTSGDWTEGAQLCAAAIRAGPDGRAEFMRRIEPYPRRREP